MKTDNATTELATECDFFSEMFALARDTNHVYTKKGISPVFQNHYVTDNAYGIQMLILEILENNGATFELGSHENSAMADIIIAASLFTSQIWENKENAFGGSWRYPLATIQHYLSVYMPKKGTIGRIQLSNDQDKDRPAGNDKPRCKWYAPIGMRAKLKAEYDNAMKIKADKEKAMQLA